MSVIVKKFGGTSLATSSHIMHQARKIRDEIKKGNQVIIIVSAMNKTTDELGMLASEISMHPNTREMDMLLTSGERISMSLFAMALNSFHIQSCSFTGSQVGIITSDNHNNARILKIRGQRLRDALKRGITPVIAGFQGVSERKEITTLGRGGSDTTAAAVAAYMKADICEIYTDVDAVFSADPRIVYNAKYIESISYDEMLVMADLGTRVLHPRAVEIARRFGIPLCVKSSFNQGVGTMVVDRDNIESMEIRGISHSDDLSIVQLKCSNDIISVLDTVYSADVKIRFIIKRDNEALSFVVKSDDVNRVLGAIEQECSSISVNSDISAVSIIGYAITEDKTSRDVLLKLTAKYADAIESFIFSELAVTIIIKSIHMEKLVREAAKAFSLENDE